MSDTTLDVRAVPPAKRHPKIHEAFDDLDSGESLTILNDHDPKPLFYSEMANRSLQSAYLAIVGVKRRQSKTRTVVSPTVIAIEENPIWSELAKSPVVRKTTVLTK
ncbi:hypothetical protein C440_04443 [Haloferax mucosum ATCC BAA-1512]|uniref:DUF2249 domain-containing protein n=1 Tax=Haloferax mucosum ATCC BAA-1512 TaxID=662479 RepID=M0IJN8_9EURY|nr:hypothetical protein C440_04443 [Haloferax mucosum ATCC BAA-1512]